MIAPASVAIVGAFPPPVHGFALINAELSCRLAALVDTVRLLPTSPRAERWLPYHADKLARALSAALGLLPRQRHRRSAVVIGLDGDAGIWLNLAQAYLARLRGHDLFLYHHSARFLAQPNPAIRLLVGQPFVSATHVMCSASMGRRFGEVYGWRGRTQIIGNLAYVAEPLAVRPRCWPTGPITLGFLSNLMRSKGVLLAVETLRELERRSVDARLLVAGPFVEPDVELELRTAERELGGRMKLVGRVDDAAKASFYDAVDLFLFPTAHPHETQSLVVPEALASGIPVIASAHGYVAELLPPSWPGMIDANLPFAPAAADLIVRWSGLPSSYADLANLARRHFLSLKSDADLQLTGFLELLRRGAPVT